MKTANWLSLIGRRLRLAPAALVVLLAVPVYAQVEEVQPTAAPGSVPGTIYGAVRPPYGETFRGATVTLTDEKSKAVLKTTTNATGDYEFKNLPDGAYTIHVESDGYAPTGRFGVSPGAGINDFQIRGVMFWEPLGPRLFTPAYNSSLGLLVRNSTWAFAYLEVVHLLGLTMLLGSVVALGLRLSNMAMRSLPTAEVAREIRPYMLVGLGIALFSGLLMFAAEAEKLFLSGPFQWKMAFFILANVFQFTAVSWLARSRDGSSLAFGKIAALLSVVFWYVVAWEGRAIAFF